MTDRLPDEELPDDLDADLDVDVDEFAEEAEAHAAAQADASAGEPAAEGTGPTFYEAGLDALALEDVALAGRPSVLERLGPAHFRSKEFRFMGFLQTVYNHVAEQVSGTPNGDDA